MAPIGTHGKALDIGEGILALPGSASAHATGIMAIASQCGVDAVVSLRIATLNHGKIALLHQSVIGNEGVEKTLELDGLGKKHDSRCLNIEALHSLWEQHALPCSQIILNPTRQRIGMRAVTVHKKP